MGLISPNNRKLPTPSSVRLLAKIAIRWISLLGFALAFIPLSDAWHQVISASIPTLIGTINDVQDWFGVEISGNQNVQLKDVGEINDEALKTTLKMIAFFTLVNIYFLL